MNTLLNKLFIQNWPRKGFALLSAIVIWLFVNQSITTTRTISSIPVRIINLDSDKTIEGLLPNGTLSRQISLTLTGTKTGLEALTSHDFEAVINAENKDDEWIASITKTSLVSLNPSFDLSTLITEVSPYEMTIHLTKLVTESVPVFITPPSGDPPRGYQFLDLWPQKLMQTVSGPESQVQDLKTRGLKLSFNLSKITKEDLDAVSNPQQDEILFPVPKNWKRIAIPFRVHSLEEINDPQATNLYLTFLRQELLPLKTSLPVSVFFPLKSSSTTSPEKLILQTSSLIQMENGIHILSTPLLVSNVSRLFLDIVRDNLQVVIVAAPPPYEGSLKWSLQFINLQTLEDTYVAAVLKENPIPSELESQSNALQYLLRRRFQGYVRNLELVRSDEKKFDLEIFIQGNAIIVTDISSKTQP